MVYGYLNYGYIGNNKMINEFIFMIFHCNEYSGGFWENYKQMREIKKMNKEIIGQSERRRKLLK